MKSFQGKNIYGFIYSPRIKVHLESHGMVIRFNKVLLVKFLYEIFILIITHKNHVWPIYPQATNSYLRPKTWFIFKYSHISLETPHNPFTFNPMYASPSLVRVYKVVKPEREILAKIEEYKESIFTSDAQK